MFKNIISWFTSMYAAIVFRLTVPRLNSDYELATPKTTPDTTDDEVLNKNTRGLNYYPDVLNSFKEPVDVSVATANGFTALAPGYSERVPETRESVDNIVSDQLVANSNAQAGAEFDEHLQSAIARTTDPDLTIPDDYYMDDEDLFDPNKFGGVNEDGEECHGVHQRPLTVPCGIKSAEGITVEGDVILLSEEAMAGIRELVLKLSSIYPDYAMIVPSDEAFMGISEKPVQPVTIAAADTVEILRKRTINRGKPRVRRAKELAGIIRNKDHLLERRVLAMEQLINLKKQARCTWARLELDDSINLEIEALRAA